MYCHKCGKKLLADSKYCDYCGASVDVIIDTIDLKSEELVCNNNKNIHYTGEHLNQFNKKKIIFAVITLIIGMSFAIKMHHSMPPNAIVYLYVHTDDEGVVKKEYYGYPTVKYYDELIKHNYESTSLDVLAWEAIISPNLVKTTATIAEKSGAEPAYYSLENGDFESEPRTLIGYILEKMGLLPDTNRWNLDGTWRY